MEAGQLIAEVARTTGVRLDRSDPILAAAVIHEALLNEALVKLDRQVAIQADRVTAASTQAVVDAKKQAELLLTDAGSWIEARIMAAGEAAASRVVAQLQEETSKAERANRITVRIAWFISAVGLMALSGLCGLLLAGLR
jgi:hypothetical protein